MFVCNAMQNIIEINMSQSHYKARDEFSIFEICLNWHGEIVCGDCWNVIVRFIYIHHAFIAVRIRYTVSVHQLFVYQIPPTLH